jgi:hypothetical protein
MVSMLSFPAWQHLPFPGLARSRSRVSRRPPGGWRDAHSRRARVRTRPVALSSKSSLALEQFPYSHIYAYTGRMSSSLIHFCHQRQLDHASTIECVGDELLIEPLNIEKQVVRHQYDCSLHGVHDPLRPICHYVMLECLLQSGGRPAGTCLQESAAQSPRRRQSPGARTTSCGKATIETCVELRNCPPR